MQRVGGGSHNGHVEDAKGMLTVALLGVVVAIVVNDFIDEASGLDGIAETVLDFTVPIIAVAVLLKIMGYI